MKYQYGKVETGMSVFMDDTAAAGTADTNNIGKGIQNCRRMEIENHIQIKENWINGHQHGKEPERVIEERVKEGIVQATVIYKYLGYTQVYTQQIWILEKSYTTVK